MDGMWEFLLVGGFGAVGAALALGTMAALVHVHRTGESPGSEPGKVAPGMTTGRLVGLWARVVIGASVATWAIVSLKNSGLLGW